MYQINKRSVDTQLLPYVLIEVVLETVVLHGDNITNYFGNSKIIFLVFENIPVALASDG